eukprot:gene3169-13182_t
MRWGARPTTTCSYFRTENKNKFNVSAPQEHGFVIHALGRKANNPVEWFEEDHQFWCGSVEEAEEWAAAINNNVELNAGERPRHLLVVVNPFGGAKQAVQVWEKQVQPLLLRAHVTYELLLTERRDHAKDRVAELTPAELSAFDGMVAVGGDGLFQELMIGLLHHHSVGPEHEKASCRMRLGHIPAGSTDACAYTLHGTRSVVASALNIILGDRSSLDPPWNPICGGLCRQYHPSLHGTRSVVASALHIILGDRSSLDVGRILSPKTGVSKFFVCQAAYGFFGDVMTVSETMRAVGPLRYDLAGFYNFLANKAYGVSIKYQRAGPPAAESDMSKSVSGAIDGLLAPLPHLAEPRRPGNTPYTSRSTGS